MYTRHVQPPPGPDQRDDLRLPRLLGPGHGPRGAALQRGELPLVHSRSRGPVLTADWSPGLRAEHQPQPALLGGAGRGAGAAGGGAAAVRAELHAGGPRALGAGGRGARAGRGGGVHAGRGLPGILRDLPEAEGGVEGGAGPR